MNKSTIHRTFIFDNSDRKYWIKSINSLSCSLRNNIGEEKKVIKVLIKKAIGFKEFQPALIVLLACFIKHLNLNNYAVNLVIEDKYLEGYLLNDLEIKKYFNEKLDHVASKKESILNLWHVDTCRAEEYGLSVTNFLQRKYFKEYDLSALKGSLDEIYANIADHSCSNGNAFSFVHYDENEKKVSIAACDFGLGIPFTLRNSGREYNLDSEALKDSLNLGVTAQSQKHNKGAGLDNIVSALSSGCKFRLVSNKSLLYFRGQKSDMRIFDLDFDFKGTLIYFELLVNSFPIEEFVEDSI